LLGHLRFDPFAETAWAGPGSALATYVAIILATAIATYFAVEAPSRRVLRRWFALAPAPAPAAAMATRSA
jgi:peptidoglycan/LPS O-acetylase OafA/YrhL